MNWYSPYHKDFLRASYHIPKSNPEVPLSSSKLPTVYLSASVETIDEDSVETIVLSFQRDKIDSNLTVFYHIGGTANSSNYTGAVSGQIASLTIPAGQTTATLTLTLILNSEVAPDKTIIVTLLDNSSYKNGAPYPVEIILVNNDKPSISLSVSPESVLEDSGLPLVYTFSRDASFDELVVNYTISGSAIYEVDYTQTGAETYDGTTGSITLANGVGSIDLSILPIHNTLRWLNKTITLTLTENNNYSITTVNGITGTIIEADDPAQLLISPLTLNYEMTIPTTNVEPQIITLTNTGESTAEITDIVLTSSNSDIATSIVDWTGLGGSPNTTIAPGASKTFTLSFNPLTYGSFSALDSPN